MLFGTLAEALAEGRGRAQAASLRATRSELNGKKLTGKGDAYDIVPASTLAKDDLVLVETGDLIPADGEVVAGVASVNEAALTGESAPVIREAGGDRRIDRSTAALEDIDPDGGGTNLLADHHAMLGKHRKVASEA